MPNTYKPAAVRLLALVVEKYCEAHGIVAEDDRNTVAEHTLALYSRGVTGEEDLLAALAEQFSRKAAPKRLENERVAARLTKRPSGH